MRMGIEFSKFTPELELGIAILFKFRGVWESESELPKFLDQLFISGYLESYELKVGNSLIRINK